MVNLLTAASGLLVFPIRIYSPWRATPTHAPLSQVREACQLISPGIDASADMVSFSCDYSKEPGDLFAFVSSFMLHNKRYGIPRAERRITQVLDCLAVASC